MPNTIAFGCPNANAQVPGTFSVSGSYTYTNPNNSVKCTLNYTDAGSVARSICRVCIVTEARTGATWCARFDMSAHLPAAGAILSAAAVLYDTTGTQVAGPATKGVVYGAGAADPCTCSGAGSPC